MKKFIFMLALAVSIGAFAQDTKKEPAAKGLAKKLIGAWKIDVDFMIGKMKGLPPEAIEQVKGQMSNSKAVFTATTISVNMGPKNEQVTYKVLGEKGKELSVEVTEKKGRTTKNTFIIDGDVLSVKENGKVVMKFIRIKKK